jgi:F-type H+-transporting ATPase subunit gamma
MASLQFLRSRLRGVKATQKITQAMKMVAAAKLKRATDRVHGMQPYVSALSELLQRCLAGVDAAEMNLLRQPANNDAPLYVVVGGERGLCGAFNGNLLRDARQSFRRHRSLGQNWKIICFGKKPYDGLIREFSNNFPASYEPTLWGRRPQLGGLNHVQAADLATQLVDGFVAGRYSSVTLLYNRFVSTMRQEPTHLQLLPLNLTSPDTNQLLVDDFEYSDPRPVLLEKLLASYLAAQIYGVMLENAAGEQAARMVAMDNASRNAGKMISRLSLQYNRQRQSNITKEIIEIVSGAGAA